MTQPTTIILAHAAEPAVLIGGPVLMLLLFVVFQWRARHRDRKDDEH